MNLRPVEHFFNIFFIKLDSPLVKTLERENLILMKKMLKKCSTGQRFFRKRNTTYKIGTLVDYLLGFKPESFLEDRIEFYL